MECGKCMPAGVFIRTAGCKPVDIFVLVQPHEPMQLYVKPHNEQCFHFNSKESVVHLKRFLCSTMLCCLIFPPQILKELSLV